MSQLYLWQRLELEVKFAFAETIRELLLERGEISQEESYGITEEIVECQRLIDQQSGAHMAKVLRIEVTDDTCVEGETYQHTLPVDHSYSAAAEAVETLYPNMTSLHIYVDDAEDV